MTSAASAIWGTHLGETKLVASTAGKPADDKPIDERDLDRRRNDVRFILKTVPWPDLDHAHALRQAHHAGLRNGENQKLHPLFDKIARGEGNDSTTPSAGASRLCSIFIASRHQERIAALHPVALRNLELNDPPWHGCREAARRCLDRFRRRQGIGEIEASSPHPQGIHGAVRPRRTTVASKRRSSNSTRRRPPATGQDAAGLAP